MRPIKILAILSIFAAQSAFAQAPSDLGTAQIATTKITYSSCNVDGQFISITFDDGPHAQHTPRLLDMLKQRGIKATFFVLGQNVAEYPEITKRIVDEGHEIANHSYTHTQLTKLSDAGLKEEMDKTHQAVAKVTGVQMKNMRPPYGALSDVQRRWMKSTMGYNVILWDVDPLDWKVRDAGRVEQEIVGKTRAGSIVLVHDIHKTTVDAMPATLDALTAKGFKFVTVASLLAMDKGAAPKAPAAPVQPEAPKDGAKDVPKSPKTSQTDRGAKEAGASEAKVQDAAVQNTVKVRSKEESVVKVAKDEKVEKTEKVEVKKTGANTTELREKWLQIQNQR